MNKADKYYIENIKKIITDGCWDNNPRPKWSDGTPAYSKFITNVFEEYDLSKGEFPIPTLRNTSIKIGIKEMFWIYQKQTSSLQVAREIGINWWEEWNIGDDTIGQRYGATIKKYDLVNKLLDGLKNDPFSRRHIIDMYQYSDLTDTPGLHPCAYSTTWSVRHINNEYILDMHLNQRSNDYLMASHINKIQYVALQMVVAKHCGFKIGKFTHLVNNLHVYDRHMDSLNELLERKPLDIQPSIELISDKSFYDFTIDDFIVKNIDGIEKLSSKLEIAI